MSLIVRRIHMYAALFLTPWVLMYALSTLVMNHGLSRGKAQFAVVDERDLAIEVTPGEARDAVAARVLEAVGREGRHGVWGSLADGQIGAHRHRALRDQLVKIDLAGGTVAVEEEDFDLVRVLNRLHRRRGYQDDYAKEDAWAFGVELFIVAMLFWAGSGLWMFWELRVTRRWGLVALGSSLAVFALFVATL